MIVLDIVSGEREDSENSPMLPGTKDPMPAPPLPLEPVLQEIVSTETSVLCCPRDFWGDADFAGCGGPDLAPVLDYPGMMVCLSCGLYFDRSHAEQTRFGEGA